MLKHQSSAKSRNSRDMALGFANKLFVVCLFFAKNSLSTVIFEH
jgi:hypothetical protein